MHRKKIIEVEVEKTLSVFDNLESPKGNPFLFTRIMAKIDNSGVTESKAAGKFRVLRPAMLIILAVVNLYSFISYSTSSSESVQITNNALTQLAKEYNLQSTTEYLTNLEDSK